MYMSYQFSFLWRTISSISFFSRKNMVVGDVLLIDWLFNLFEYIQQHLLISLIGIDESTKSILRSWSIIQPSCQSLLMWLNILVHEALQVYLTPWYEIVPLGLGSLRTYVVLYLFQRNLSIVKQINEVRPNKFAGIKFA